MIVFWTDQDGDPVAVDTSLIGGVSVGDVTGPQPAGSPTRVTLIWLCGIAQPFMVRDEFGDVVAAWSKVRQEQGPPSYPPRAGWTLQYPHPSTVLPDPIPPWAPTPTKEGTT